MTPGDAELAVPPPLRAKRLRLHTQHQAVVIMRTDCHVCRSEGLAARAQVLVSSDGREVQATLFQIEGDDLLAIDQIALTETAWKILDLDEDAAVTVTHAPTLESLASVRRRIYGNRLDAHALGSIVRDVAARRYTDVHLAAFLTASAALPLDEQETIDLTGAMVDVGERLRWESPIVLDKHCIGGLPGNRTTPHRRRDRCRQRARHPQDLFARDHLAGRYCGCNGDTCPGRPRYRDAPTRRGSRGRLHRLGRSDAPEPRRRYFRPHRA